MNNISSKLVDADKAVRTSDKCTQEQLRENKIYLIFAHT